MPPHAVANDATHAPLLRPTRRLTVVADILSILCGEERVGTMNCTGVDVSFVHVIASISPTEVCLGKMWR